MQQLLRRFRKPPSDKPRIHFLDELRGFAVFCMIFYHGFFTFSTLFPSGFGLTLYRIFSPLEPIFAALFLFLSGICSNLSRSNLSRGIKLAAIAVIVSLVTILFVPGEAIWFGILHLLALSMIVTGLTLPWLNRLPVWPAIAVCAIITALTYNIWSEYLGFFEIPLIPLPKWLYATNWLCWLGMYNHTFHSADYFPVLPWMFVFLGGVFFGRFAKDGRFPQWTYRRHVPFFSFLGRHALIIYIVHQPVFYGIGMLLELIK